MFQYDNFLQKYKFFHFKKKNSIFLNKNLK